MTLLQEKIPKKKIEKVSNFLKRKKINYLFISAPENVAWLLNIRGSDNPYSPIPNCRLIIDSKKRIYLITEKIKTKNLLKQKKIKNYQLIEPNQLVNNLNKFKKGKFIIDKKTCSIFFENLLKKDSR